MTRRSLVGVGVAGAVLLGVGGLPLFGGPTYEYALACGVLLPAAAAVTSGLEAAHASPTLPGGFRRSLAIGAAYVCVAWAVALLHGARAGFCDLGGQTAYLCVGPFPGVLLGAVWGGVCGTFVHGVSRPLLRSFSAGAAAFSVPLVTLGVSFWRYWTSPMIFAFDHFFGYFSGTLYDTEIDAIERLLTYRAGTVGLILAGWASLRLADLSRSGALGWRGSRLPLAVLVGGLGGFWGVTASGARLGHFETTAGVREALGHVAAAARCDVIYSGGVARQLAHALARDCDAHLAQHERFFEVQFEPRVSVYLFASAQQRAALMGARYVNIAKPWRNEVYILQQGYPHPVLGHELAHVVAGAFGEGPFRVAGPAGGWVPDPGRIEGIAVAAAPNEADDLTLLEWSKAMRDLRLLPRLETLFRLTFLGENSSKAYVAAGAFISWLREQSGMQAVRRWYGGATLEQATGKRLAELEESFLRALDAAHISDAALELARSRFEQPAVFGRTCPHEIDALLGSAAAALGALDPAGARARYEAVLRLEPDNVDGRSGSAACDLREGKLQEAAAGYTALSTDTALAQPARARAMESVADVAVLSGKVGEATKLYAEARGSLFDEDHLRRLDVKGLMGTGELPLGVLRALFLGDPELGVDWTVAGPELGRWAERERKSGIPDYLIGYNAYQRGRWSEAAERLDAALGKGVAEPSVRREALRTRVFVGCALGQKRAAESSLRALLAEGGLRPARRLGITRFAERCGILAGG